MTPLVSVVMGVYNSADSLERTLASILDQRGVDLELIVVDDGSSDNTAAVLKRLERVDGRLRVIRQGNAGLTVSLQRACALAQGKFIARQDAGGDISLPGRLARQVALLEAEPDAVLVCCGARFVGPAGESLYEISFDSSFLIAGLTADRLESLAGPPHHGGTMFRLDAYVRAGGYRENFVVAQDIDLWLRLFELGSVAALDEVLYEARLDHRGISARRGRLQLTLGRAALESAQIRRSGGDDGPVLEAMRVQIGASDDDPSVPASNFDYFIGNCLRERDPVNARKYYLRALRDNPLHLKAAVNYMRTFA